MAHELLVADLADRPDPRGSIEQIFYARDTKQLFVTEGDDWEEVPTATTIDTLVQPGVDQAAVDATVAAAIAALVDSAPGALDTLNELAAALGDDENYAANLAATIAQMQAATAAAQLDADQAQSQAVSAMFLAQDSAIRLDSYVAVSQTAPQALGDGDGVTFFPVIWSTGVSDASGFHAQPSANLIIPAGLAGKYEISAAVTLDAPAAGNDYAIRLTRNGNQVARFNISGPANTFVSETLNMPAVVSDGDVGDVFNVEVLHNEGAALNTVAASTVAQLRKIAA